MITNEGTTDEFFLFLPVKRQHMIMHVLLSLCRHDLCHWCPVVVPCQHPPRLVVRCLQQRTAQMVAPAAMQQVVVPPLPPLLLLLLPLRLALLPHRQKVHMSRICSRLVVRRSLLSCCPHQH